MGPSTVGNHYVSDIDSLAPSNTYVDAAIALVDRKLERILSFQYDDSPDAKTCSSAWTPYGGGIVDFADIRKRADFAESSPKTFESRDLSMRTALEWRLSNASWFTQSTKPTEYISSILQKIVLSKWTLTLAFLQRDFHSIPLKNLADDSVGRSEVKGTLEDLDSSRDLLHRCLFLVRKNLSQFGIVSLDGSPRYFSSMEGYEEPALLRMDWEFLYQELRVWRDDTERLVGMRIANNNVMDSKRAREDSARASIDSQRAQISADQGLLLTRLGQVLFLVYTPAGLAYGILSMGGDFAPGNSKFWVFFAIATPLSALTMLTTYFTMRGMHLNQARRELHVAMTRR